MLKDYWRLRGNLAFLPLDSLYTRGFEKVGLIKMDPSSAEKLFCL